MKKQTITNDLRKDWKNEAEDEIIKLQENIDELGLPESTVLELEKLIDKFKERLNDTIDLFNVTPKIALIDNDFFEDCLWEVEKISGISTYRNEEFKKAVQDGKPFEFDAEEVLTRTQEVTAIPVELRKLKLKLAKITEDLDTAIAGLKQNDFLAYGKPKDQVLPG